jgi:hypothetical protein
MTVFSSARIVLGSVPLPTWLTNQLVDYGKYDGDISRNVENYVMHEVL